MNKSMKTKTRAFRLYSVRDAARVIGNRGAYFIPANQAELDKLVKDFEIPWIRKLLTIPNGVFVSNMLSLESSTTGVENQRSY